MVDTSPDTASQTTDYGQRKYVSEQHVGTAAPLASKEPEKFSVIQPALLIGNKTLGVANSDDLLGRIFATAIRIGPRSIEIARS